MSLIPLILVTFMVILFVGLRKPNRVMKSKSNKTPFRINRSTHYKLLTGFIALLLVLTVIVEIMEPRRQSVTPIKQADAEFLHKIDLIDSQIFNREDIDPSFIIEERTHLVGNTLTINRNDDPFERPYIYIERKPNNDETIEELLYKPILVVDDFDFSDKIRITKPIWTDNTVTFPKGSKTEINYIHFQEATMLKQLTKLRFQESLSSGYGSMSRPNIIHLKVPKDLKIFAENEDELLFIDEFD